MLHPKLTSVTYGVCAKFQISQNAKLLNYEPFVGTRLACHEEQTFKKMCLFLTRNQHFFYKT